MARLVNNTQELVNKAQQYRIATENKSIEQIAQDVIDRLMVYYDEYTCYIDNYRQQLEAEQRNEEILEEVNSIRKLILQVNNMQYCVYVGDPTYFYQEEICYAGTKEECQAYIEANKDETPYDDTTKCSYRMEKTPILTIKQIVKLKEESIMKTTTNNTATNNHNVSKKEETIMEKVKVISKNLLNTKGETNELSREFTTLAEAQTHAKYLAECKSVLAVTIVNGTEVIKIKEEIIMTTENNTSANNCNANKKEEIVMKRDYTLGGIFASKTLKEFKQELKNFCGIKCGKKDFETLKSEALAYIQSYDPKWYVLASHYGVYCTVDTKEEAKELAKYINSTVSTLVSVWTPIQFGNANGHLDFIEHLTQLTKEGMIYKFPTKERLVDELKKYDWKVNNQVTNPDPYFVFETNVTTNIDYFTDTKLYVHGRNVFEPDDIVLYGRNVCLRDDECDFIGRPILKPEGFVIEATDVSDEVLIFPTNKEEIVMGKVNSTTTSNQNASTNNVKEECIMKTNKTQKATATVSVGDLDITRDNAPDESITEPVDNRNAKAKTDRLFALLKNYAAQNEKNGYGYTISSYMLQACILDAGAGVKKFKGHKVTEEESKMTHTVYKWLKDNGFIKPVVYSVVEDPNVRVFTPDYTGRTDTKTKLVPFAKSKGYTAKQVTSFMVTVR